MTVSKTIHQPFLGIVSCTLEESYTYKLGTRTPQLASTKELAGNNPLYHPNMPFAAQVGESLANCVVIFSLQLPTNKNK